MDKASKPNIQHQPDNSITLTLDHPKYSLIWMHGLGDSSSGFLNYFQKPNSPLYSGARIRLLQAPQRKVTVSGSTCNSWYDIRTFNKAAGNDEQRYSMEEVRESYGIIDKEVKKEVEFWEKEQGIKEGAGERQVYLGGFSQGCAMSLFYGLQCERPIAGIIGFSGYLFDSTKTTNLGKTNILLNHGDHDSRAELPHSEKTYQRIFSDPHVKFVKYPGMDHEVIDQQLPALTSWLKQSQSNKSKL